MQYKTLSRPLEVKAVNEEGHFSGYGSVFGNIDLHRDIILPGAFSKSIDRHQKNGTMPAMLWQHDMRDVVGKYNSIEEDDRGLKLSGRLFIKNSIPEADKAYTLLREKAVSGMSIGFNIPKGGDEYNKEKDVWEIKEVDLVEVSIVTWPANPEAQIESVKSALDNPRKFERLLRDAGLTPLQARRLMSGGYDALLKRDAEEDDDEAHEMLAAALASWHKALSK